MVTSTKLETVLCACGCGLKLFALDAFWDEDSDKAYASIDHLSEDQVTVYLERYDDVQESYFYE